MSTAPQRARRAEILALLYNNPQGLSARAVAKLQRIHYTTANDDLQVLSADNLVHAEGENPRLWRIT